VTAAPGFTTRWGTSHAAATERVEPSLRLIAKSFALYQRLFVSSELAPLLSRPNPVRYTDFDMDLAIAQVKVEAEGVVSVTLAAPQGSQLPVWSPGSHLDVFLPSGRQRQYSLCGDPADRSRYRIAVRLIPDGGGSREVHETLRPGDRLRVRGPRNAFSMVTADSYLFIAAGIGITPILPMVKSANQRGIPWRMVYLGRNRDSMPFLSELEKCTGGVVEVRPDDEFGRPDIGDLLTRARPGGATYVCGPPPVLEAARTLMSSIDSTGSLHTERFSAPTVVGGAPFDVQLSRSGITVSVGAAESALAAIRRAVPGVAYSCQQGYCGSCKIGVLAGGVEHRDHKLLESERDDAMLICVSRSSGGPLVLDL
jgi:ferredoxin-NADP reductase